jgi:hypothetical protein
MNGAVHPLPPVCVHDMHKENVTFYIEPLVAQSQLGKA